MNQRGPALVRIALLSLFFGAFALALVQPAQAGTETAPEIQDATNDHELLEAVPPCAGTTCQFAGVDLVSAWISNETTTDFKVNIKLAGAPGSNNQYANVWQLTGKFAGTDFTVSATTVGGAAPAGPTAGGIATSVTVSGNTLVLTVPKSALGTVAAGSTLTNLAASATRSLFVGPVLVSDSAGPGLDYTFTGGTGGNITAGDTDGDGLNDTCERTYFGGLNSTANATADPDGDGLTNGQECALGTDPTKADTDGDGVNDKNDPFPTDPTKGGTSSGTSTSTSSGTRTSSSSRTSTSGTGTGSGSTTGSGTNDDADGDVQNLGDAVEKLKSDIDYLGISGGGMLAVLILAILALAVRWSL